MRPVLLPLLPAALSAGAPAGPRFSWDTVPVFYHSCNFTGPYTDAAVDIMAKFPMVTIEKGQGVHDPNDQRYAEDKIVDTLRRVKAVDSNISTIFYYNSVLDWPFYRLHEEFLKHPDWWTKKKDGSVCRMGGDGSFPNHTNMLTFDFAQAAVRDFFASECINVTQTGVVDGCFSDRATGGACDAGQAYKDGHILMHQELQKALGNGVLIANNADIPGVGARMFEGFNANEGSIQNLISSSAKGELIQAHAHSNCKNDITDTLAAFLIGAGHKSYYACSGGWKVQADPIDTVWHAEYDKPLGAPKGAAVKTGNVYRREFSNSVGTTAVTFDTSSNQGQILWAGEPTPPPTPVPPPPPPPGPLPSYCGTPILDTGMANFDLGHEKTTASFAECCTECKAMDGCVVWAWHGEQGGTCHFHTAAQPAPGVKGCVSGYVNATA